MERTERKYLAKNARYYHFNIFEQYPSKEFIPGKGTVCIGTLPEGNHIAGISLCSPDDQFVKLDGRHRALRRVLQPKSLFRMNVKENTMEEAKEALCSLLNMLYEDDFENDLWQEWMGGNFRTVVPRGKRK